MGQPKEKRENKWISRGLNRGGWANLSKKEKTNGLVGAKNRGRGRPKEKRENKWISKG